MDSRLDVAPTAGVPGVAVGAAAGGNRERFQGLATVGLVLVLLSASGFALWSSQSTSASAQRAITASRLADSFAAAATAVAAEESLERKYRLEPGPEVLARYRQAAADLVTALAAVRRAGDVEDRDAVDRVLAAHGPYLDAIGRMFAAVDRGDAAEVLRIDGEEVDPQFAVIENVVDDESRDHHAQALGTLADLHALELFTARATPIVFVIGLVLVGFFASVLRRLRLKLDVQYAHALHHSLHDALTGLPNRSLLADRLAQSLRAGRREPSSTGLLLIDLDRFREINDTLGHRYGDHLLTQIGPRLAGCLREVDTVARLGGDEFAVLLPDVEGVGGALLVAERIRAALAGTFTVEGIDLDVEASIGVVMSGVHGDDAATLLQRADVAMYVAKNQGLGLFAYVSRAGSDGGSHSPRG